MTVNSPLASPRATLDKLAAWGIITRKSLGQHFLVDDGVVGRILRLAAIQQDEAVLEVGPGIGTLTEALLLEGARVLAIEKDPRLLPILADMKSRYPQSFDFLVADALEWESDRGTTESDRGTVNLTTFQEKLSSFPSPCHFPSSCHSVSAPSSSVPPAPRPQPGKLVANLPYAVAATIVLDYFQRIDNIQSATVMVQKEVAARMQAKPGSRDYGAYSVKLQLIAEPKGSFQVSRSCFLPPPRVDSTVIRLDRREDQIRPDEIPGTFKLIEAAFAERRKTIRNSMRSHLALQGLDPGIVDILLETAKIPPSNRAESLKPDEFQKLGRIFAIITAQV